MSLYERLPPLLAQLNYPTMTFAVRKSGDDYHLRVECPDGTCNVTGMPDPWNGRWWRLSEHMTDGEIVQTAFKAVLTALEHEARERFTYKGVSVFDPHYDIEALVALRTSSGGGLKERDHHD